MSLISHIGRRDQIEFVFDLTFEKILHIPKRATEVQILWTRGKKNGKSAITTVVANAAIWGTDSVNSVKIVSSLFKELSSSNFQHKGLLLEVVALQNKKVIFTVSHCVLNLADYVSNIFDLAQPSKPVHIHEKMTCGCVVCFRLTAQFSRAKCGDWKPAGAISSVDRDLVQDQELQTVAISSTSAAGQKSKTSKATSPLRNVMIGPVDEHTVSLYIGDAGIELLLRLFSKYDCDRSGRFQIEQVACMLSEIGHSSVADDLRTGKASLTQSLDIFSSPDSVRSGALQMNFSSFVSWIAANRLASKLHVARSARETKKESARSNYGAALGSDPD
jgi:hypothetical protein